MSAPEARKRLKQSSPPWQPPSKDQRRTQEQDRPQHAGGEGLPDSDITARREQESFAREQTRLNQIQEAEQMREWVSKEDEFVLKQSKKKAHIRVKEGRAKTIDWLAVTLGVIDDTRDPLEDDEMESDIDVIDPSGVFDGLSLSQLQDLAKDIDTYMGLESNYSNRKYWNALQVICRDHQTRIAPTVSLGRSNDSVTTDVDRLLSPKTLSELLRLEKQVSDKLQSNEPIDVEYWEQLLRDVAVYKSKAELNAVYKSIVESRLSDLRQEQRAEAADVKQKLSLLSRGEVTNSAIKDDPLISYSRRLDPEPLLKLRAEDKGLDVIEEKDFMDKIVSGQRLLPHDHLLTVPCKASDRRRVVNLGYVPLRHSQLSKRAPLEIAKTHNAATSEVSRFTPIAHEDFSSATKALYEREVARGVQEDEEIFAGEEEVSTASKPQWANKYRPRKPRYFNRVQMGYEWNKYNQTHYDHDNPPPKVVQGYKFNIFYPDLIDKIKAPTYRIERENGRKRGESFAPAGEEDTCLIRFISGPPYEDFAFRIVDKEWDFSAKRERGFKSSFDKVSSHNTSDLSVERILRPPFREYCNFTFNSKRFPSSTSIVYPILIKCFAGLLSEVVSCADR